MLFFENATTATTLQCPLCGGKKDVMSISDDTPSGETTLWSDDKWYDSMRPQVSCVQRCAHCGKYYYNFQNVYYGESENESCDLGELTYQELKDAFEQLHPTGIIETDMRMMLLWSFNDLFGKAPKKKIPDDEWNYFKTNTDRLLEIIDDDILKVEIYREQEEFEQASALLRQIAEDPEDSDATEITNKFRDHIEKKQRKVFVLYGDAKRVAVTH